MTFKKGDTPKEKVDFFTAEVCKADTRNVRGTLACLSSRATLHAVKSMFGDDVMYVHVLS